MSPSALVSHRAYASDWTSPETRWSVPRTARVYAIALTSVSVSASRSNASVTATVPRSTGPSAVVLVDRTVRTASERAGDTAPHPGAGAGCVHQDVTLHSSSSPRTVVNSACESTTVEHVSDGPRRAVTDGPDCPFLGERRVRGYLYRGHDPFDEPKHVLSPGRI